jgi:hypothetical protein
MFMPASQDSTFAPPPAGAHIAVCFRVIDLGTQKVEWQGDIKFQRKILLSWELPNETMEDGRPFSISQRYTFSSSEKARLRKDLESWRGRKFTEADFGPGGFDIKNVLGAACMLSIVHETKDGKTYANISGVTGVPKGMPKPTPTNSMVYFSLDRERFDRAVMEGLSDNLKTTIKNSPEYQELTRPAPAPDESGYGEPPPYDHDPLDQAIPF